MPPNVHHLELFYYVARHGGIMNAVRRMPYGIQQPAVSGQILKLEESLGVKLFHRRPFLLTPEGEKLFAFCEPFFGHLEDLADELSCGGSTRLRLASSASVLKEHLPPLLTELKTKFPKARITLIEANQAAAEQALLRNEIEIAFTEFGSSPATGIQSRTLMRLPLVLIVKKERGMPAKAEACLNADTRAPLIAFPATETLTRTFCDHLARMGQSWFPTMEVSSLELIETYVTQGFGIGLSVSQPGRIPPKNLVELPLENFPPLEIGALWMGRPAALTAECLDMAEKTAARLRELQ